MDTSTNFLTWMIAVSTMSVLILVATVVAVLWWHQRRLAQQAKAWGVHLLQAQEGERQRIAQDIHDDVVQRLSAAQMCIEGAKIEAASAMVADVARDLRTLAHDLYPSSLQHLSLGRALGDLFEGAGDDGRLAVQLECDEQVQLNDAAMAALYRTAQEGLQNVRKHSRAKSLIVSLAREGATVVLRLHDDGVGFDEQAARQSSFGLRSMRERLALVGGTLRIARAESGRGTILSATVPAS